jgi:spore coat protein U-like protein
MQAIAELRRTKVARRCAEASVGALSALWLIGPSAAHAATEQTTFTVSATVVAACAVSASNLSFGNYNPTLGSANDNQTSLLVTCTNGAGYNVGLDAGAGSGATPAARKMMNSTNALLYTLYRDSNRTLVWGDSVGSNTLASTGTGAQQTVNIYGRIGAAQTAPAGSYSDTITVTVTF